MSNKIGKTRTNQPVESDYDGFAGAVEEYLDTEDTISVVNLDVSENLSVTGDVGITGELSVADATSIDGHLSVTGDISGDNITGDSIIENMSGYSASAVTTENFINNPVYCSAVKTGNKITFVYACKITRPVGASVGIPYLCYFYIPTSIGLRLHTTQVGLYQFLDNKKLVAFDTHYSGVDVFAWIEKSNNGQLGLEIATANLVEGQEYYLRYEATFLLSDSLITE